jgi:hypothetical protein
MFAYILLIRTLTVSSRQCQKGMQGRNRNSFTGVRCLAGGDPAK